MNRGISPVRVATTCAVGLALVMLDNTAVTVALPSIRADLGGQTSDLQWVASVMPLAAAAALIGAGAIGDRIGARIGMIAGLLLFGIGAAGALASPTLAALLAARAVQGVGAALMLPNGAALLGANVPPGRGRDRAVGWWITISAIGLVAGPLAGGWVIEHLGWRWVFAVHLPFAVLGALGARRLADTTANRGGRADVAGIVCAAAGLGLLCWSLIGLGRADPKPMVVGLTFVAGVAALVAFVIVERRADRPALDISMFRNRGFAAVSAAALLYNGSIAGGSFVVSLLFQGPRGFTPAHTGVLLLLTTIGMPLGGQLTGRLAHRGGLRRVMAVGTAVLAVAYTLAAVAALGPLAMVVLPLAITGFAAGVLYSADTLAVLGTIDPAHSASALATLSLVRQVGAVLGIAVLGSLANFLATPLDQASGLRAGLLVAGLAAIPCCYWLARHLDPTLGSTRA